MKLDFSMAKAGDKYIGELEFQRPDGEYDVWTIVKRLDPAVTGSRPKGYPIYLIGTTTNSGLLSDYYYTPERGESESKSLEEINADLEVLAQDGESYMSRVKRIPKKGLKKNPYVVKEGKAFVGKFDTRREALDEMRAVASRIYNFGAESLTDRFKRMASLKMRYVRKNPPFYAHNLYEKKTHGLNLKQMRRLYAMVSRGNRKAITYARNVLGIPFSESPTQVKAVVYHHVRDLAERRVRRNPARSDVTPVVFRTFRSGGEVIALFPYELGTMDSRTMMSYEHIGQHGSADMGLTSVLTRPSTPDEIRPLKNELERIGYKLKILKRIPGDAVRVRAEKLRSMR